MTTSRYLANLDAEIQSAKGGLSADCFTAERACYLARQGNFAEARSILVRLHEQYDRNPNAIMSAWLSLAEGLMAYFASLSQSARDKLLRSRALSAAANLKPMQALSAAWLAQIDFARLDIGSVNKYCIEALSLAAKDHHSARARASLVLAHALHVAARFDLAKPWYRIAQIHATEQGDDATISALMHNMTCMRLDNFRQFKLSGAGAEEGVGIIITGVVSTGNFDQMVGASSMAEITSLLYARLLSLQGRPVEALGVYEENLDSFMVPSYMRLRSEIYSDMAWCHAQIGNAATANEMAISALKNIVAETQVDDLAATHSRLSEAFRLLRIDAKADHHDLLAKGAWQEYSILQEKIVSMLGAIAINH